MEYGLESVYVVKGGVGRVIKILVLHVVPPSGKIATTATSAAFPFMSRLNKITAK